MKNTFTTFRRGLTMLELVFVIVILGIVASIASSIIVQVYESYIVQKALHRTSTKAELAATQIANRLTYRISSAVIGRKLDGITYLPIDQVPDDDDDYKILEWIAYDNDSFSAQSTPGWSGFCDVDSNETNRTAISTPGSELTKLSTTSTPSILGNLGLAVDTDIAIVFAGHEYNATRNYIANCMGFSDNSCIYRVNANITNDIILPINDNGGTLVMTDQYKLAWSAYAVVPTQVTGSDLTDRGFQAGSEIYDLALHYNYQPWMGDTYDEDATLVSPLVTNVESFRFIGKGDTVRFKICVAESIGDSNITSCKEKAVIR